MIDVKRIWKQSMALGLCLLVGSCVPDHSHSDGGGGWEPPKPCEGFSEFEPNDDHEYATYLGNLPVLSPETVCGDWVTYPLTQDDTDYYYFFLNPAPGVTQISFNMSISTDYDATPALKLQQTLYDPNGEPSGYYQTLGVFYGSDGELLVFDFPITYDFYNKNDLFLCVEGIYPGTIAPEYEINFWF